MRLQKSWTRPVPNREPWYTLPEIADRLNMEHELLMRMLRQHKWLDAPKAVYIPNVKAVSRKKLYLLSDFKKWISDKTASPER